MKQSREEMFYLSLWWMHFRFEYIYVKSMDCMLLQPHSRYHLIVVLYLCFSSRLRRVVANISIDQPRVIN